MNTTTAQTTTSPTRTELRRPSSAAPVLGAAALLAGPRLRALEVARAANDPDDVEAWAEVAARVGAACFECSAARRLAPPALDAAAPATCGACPLAWAFPVLPDRRPRVLAGVNDYCGRCARSGASDATIVDSASDCGAACPLRALTRSCGDDEIAWWNLPRERWAEASEAARIDGVGLGTSAGGARHG